MYVFTLKSSRPFLALTALTRLVPAAALGQSKSEDGHDPARKETASVAAAARTRRRTASVSVAHRGKCKENKAENGALVSFWSIMHKDKYEKEEEEKGNIGLCLQSAGPILAKNW